jgi:hypothetical protein
MFCIILAIPINADGSKIGDSAACAAFSSTVTIARRLLDGGGGSIFTADLVAMCLTLDVVNRKASTVFICSDSLSPQAVHNHPLANPLVVDIIRMLKTQRKHKQVLFCLDPISMPMPYYDLKLKTVICSLA